MRNRILITFLLLTVAPLLAAQEEDHAIHEELRALLNGIEKAVNTERYGDLAQYFHENLRVTPINQEIMASRPEIEAYFNKWFGPGGYLKTIRMSLDADDLTEFYADKNIGIVWGSGDEDYVLSDKRTFAMKTRWASK